MATTLPLRKDVKIEDTWDLTAYFADDQAWLEECDRLEALIPEYDKYRGKLSESGKMLYECLVFDDKIGEIIDRTYNYASQSSDQDTSESKYQSYIGKISSICTRIYEASSFINVEITEMGADKLKAFKAECPALAHYDRVIDKILLRKSYTKSAVEEKLLASASEVTGAAGDIFRMFNNADLKFDNAIDSNGVEHAVTHGSYIRLLSDKDRVLRKSAFESMYKSYRSYRNTLAAMFNANLKEHSFYAKTRGFDGPIDYSLIYKNVPVEIYNRLIEGIHKALPIMYRYVDLRKKVLGVETLEMYDVYTSIVDLPDMHFTFEEAKEIVLKALAPMGEEYVNLVKEAYENRWIDVYENQGKRSGAYSTCAYGVHPYMLLNFSGTLDSVFTLAHEMGHSLHSYYSNASQSYTYANYTIFVAEVASTCNEALLNEYLIKNAKSDAEKAVYINHFIDNVKGTVFRQTMFAEFEKLAHEAAWNNETLTADRLCQIYGELNQKYFGPQMHCDENIAIEWARIPHFYRPFYVYQYSTGFTAAIALSRRILTLGEEGVEDYKKFLKGGSSMDPIDLLKLAGVDLSKDDPFESAMKHFEGLVEELEKMLLR